MKKPVDYVGNTICIFIFFFCNCLIIRTFFTFSDSLIVALCHRVTQHASKNPVLTFDIKFFDLRLFFLITALCADVRPKCLNDSCNVLQALVQILNDINSKSVLNDQDVDLTDEALKVLFNILLSSKLAKLEEVLSSISFLPCL